MAVASFALTTLNAVKAYIGGMALSATTDDSLLEDMINAASRMMILYAGREWRSLSTSGTRVFPVASDGSVELAPYELRAVSQIRANVEGATPTTLDATMYQQLPVDIGEGGGYQRIRILSGYTAPGGSTWNGSQAALGTIEITGSWGWTSVPEDVELLCRQQVRQWYERDRNSRSSVVAADDTGAPSYSSALGLAPGIKRALDIYRVPTVA